MSSSRLVLLVLATLFFGGPPAHSSGVDVTFTDVALEAGFQDRLGHGRALVAADFDGDGWLDFYVGNPGDPIGSPDESLILWNQGPGSDGRVTYARGQVLLRGEIAFTASAADYDDDGDPDLFVGVGGQEGIGLDRLFRNDGGSFTDVSETAAVRGPRAPDGRFVPTATSSGTWADYDNDGDADLFVASRFNAASLPIPNGWGWRNSLFRNEGDGTFSDVTEAAGVGSVASSMTAAWGDFDNDGWMDLYVPVHGARPEGDWEAGFRLYRNQHDGTFSLVDLPVDIGRRAVWAASVADFDRDGRLDILSFARGIPGVFDSHALLINRGGWVFTNEAAAAGIAPAGAPAPSVMGTAIGDFDNDGFPDLFFGNGGPLFTEKDTLFVSATTPGGSLAFTDVSHLVDFPAPEDPACVPPPLRVLGFTPTWVDHYEMLAARGETDCGSIDLSRLPLEPGDPCRPVYPYRGHASMFIDFDRDGDLDLAAVKGGTAIIAPQVSSTEPNRLFRNDGGNAGHWLFVELAGIVSNPDAFGAWVEVVSSNAEGRRTRRIEAWQGNTGFSASGPPEIHFGLAGDDTIESLTVLWPSGVVSRLGPMPADQRLRLVEEVTSVSDFADGRADSWIARAGDWAVEGGAFVQRSPSRGLALATVAPDADTSISARVELGSPGARATLLGRVAADGRTFYGVGLGGGTAQLFRSLDGKLTALGAPLAIDPPAAGRAHLVTLSLQGSEIRFSVDRRPGEPWTDASPLPAGTVGLATQGGAVSFDNVATW